jgi:predicted dehydrogenase
MVSTLLKYNHEYDQRLRVGFVGCGGQAFRNLLPAFQYAPVELVAVADLDEGRAARFARSFGAKRSYTDFRRMLAEETLDAVFFATGYDAEGRPLYPNQAIYALQAGCHVWIEKPPAASCTEIERLIQESLRNDRQVGVGFMKMFTPGMKKIRDIVKRKEFGAITTVYLRDPEMLPPRSERRDMRRMTFLLDHIVHSASTLHAAVGPLKRLYVEEGPGGEAIVSLKFRNGAAGVLHMPWGQSGNSPKERLEVVGQQANVVLENNTRLTYFRPGHPGIGAFEYGRIGDYISEDDQAPLSWQMDGYSGQPFNMHIFYQGYAHQILYFSECLLRNKPVAVAGLRDAWYITQFFEALQSAGEQPLELPEAPPNVTALPSIEVCEAV